MLDAAIKAEAQAYMVTRHTAGTRVNGIYTPGSTSTVSALLSVQPLRPVEAQNLPEGILLKGVVVVYSATELLVADPATSILGDQFAHDGHTWEIWRVSNWDAHGSFQRYLAVRSGG